MKQDKDSKVRSGFQIEKTVKQEDMKKLINYLETINIDQEIRKQFHFLDNNGKKS